MHNVSLILAGAVFGLALVIGLRSGKVHSVHRGKPTVVFARKDDPRAYWTAIATYALGAASCFGSAIGVIPPISEILAWLMHHRASPFSN